MAVSNDTNWRQHSTLTVNEYARIVRVDRRTAYAAIRAGEVATIRIGKRILVCVAPLVRQLEGPQQASLPSLGTPRRPR